MSRIILIAASGLAREIIASIRQTGTDEVVGILDDDLSLHGSDISGVPVVGGLEHALEAEEELLVCAGPGWVRAEIVSRLTADGIRPGRYATHIDHTAVIGGGVTIGPGTIILGGCVLTCDMVLGAHVVLMPRVVLTHDDSVGDFVTLTAGVSVGGRVTIGRCAYLGMNAAVRQDLLIGESATLGMGGVLVRNLPDGQTWAGNPARPLPARPADSSDAFETRHSSAGVSL